MKKFFAGLLIFALGFAAGFGFLTFGIAVAVEDGELIFSEPAEFVEELHENGYVIVSVEELRAYGLDLGSTYNTNDLEEKKRGDLEALKQNSNCEEGFCRFDRKI